MIFRGFRRELRIPGGDWVYGIPVGEMRPLNEADAHAVYGLVSIFEKFGFFRDATIYKFDSTKNLYRVTIWENLDEATRYYQSRKQMRTAV
jgi:hypothetical protein